MSDQNQSGQSGQVRRPEPQGAAQDPHNARVQEQIHADAEANRAQADRVRDTTPESIRDKTVGEIADDAERRAEK